MFWLVLTASAALCYGANGQTFEAVVFGLIASAIVCRRWVVPFLRSAWSEGSAQLAERMPVEATEDTEDWPEEVWGDEPEEDLLRVLPSDFDLPYAPSAVSAPSAPVQPEPKPMPKPSASGHFRICGAPSGSYRIIDGQKTYDAYKPPVEEPIEEVLSAVDYDFTCHRSLEKEKERLERVLWGLYNKRDKFDYQRKSHNTQAWRGLEYDIDEIERRLKALEAV